MATRPAGALELATLIFKAEAPLASRDAARDLCRMCEGWSVGRLVKDFFMPKYNVKKWQMDTWAFDLLCDAHAWVEEERLFAQMIPKGDKK